MTTLTYCAEIAADSKSLERDHQVIQQLVLHLAKCHILHHLMAKAVCEITSANPITAHALPAPVTGISPFDPSPPGSAGREVIGHEPSSR